MSFILPTPYIAWNLKEFVDILKDITIDSIYFHIFEAPLRLQRGMNDFSFWIKTSLDNEYLAKKILELDPYTNTMEGLRRKIIKLIKDYIGYD
jgi:hypothetical protein